MNHYYLYKKFKKNLITKYKKRSRNNITDNNLDKFVSINNFLAKEISKGPNEELNKINYHYQSYSNIYNFFRILVEYYDFNKILCIPKFTLKYKKYIDLTSIIYFIDRNEFIIPVELKKKIKKCKNSNARFIYCTFMIDNYYNKNENLNHANILIIDLYKQTIERFEPYGVLNNEIKINKAIKTRLLKHIDLENFIYLSPLDFEPIIGPQAIADSYNGMCISFCMLYLQLRLMNPDTIQKELIEYLMNKDKKELKKIVLQYAKFIQIALEKYDDIVNLTNKYINKKYNSLQKYIISSKKNDALIEFGLNP